MLASSRLAPRLRVRSGTSPLTWPVHYRTLSLWPKSSPAAASTEPNHVDTSLTAAQDQPVLPPVKPTWAELSTPSSLPDPTFFEPASAVLLSLPPSLGISYALFIPLLTLVIRGTFTLPLTLWQRARTRRFADVVMPLLRREQSRISFETRAECRRAGKSFEEYQETYKKRVSLRALHCAQFNTRVIIFRVHWLTPTSPRTQAKAAAKQLARAHSASPMLTLILPPLLHIPIFITTTLILRDACAHALVALPLTPASLTSLLTPTNPDAYSILRPELLGYLHDFASTSFLWCPSLVLPDPSMLLPLTVGLAALLNVEVTAKTRQANARAAVLGNQSTQAQGPSEGGPGAAGPGIRISLSAAEKRRLAARVATSAARPVTSTAGSGAGLDHRATPTRNYVTPSLAASAIGPAKSKSPGSSGPMTREERTALAEAEEQEKLDPRAARIMTNALRFSAVLFMPIAAMAPSVSARERRQRFGR